MKSLVILLGLLLLFSIVNANGMEQEKNVDNCKEEAIKTCGSGDEKTLCRKGIRTLCETRTIFDNCRIKANKKCGEDESKAECRVAKTLKCREKSLGAEKIEDECTRRAFTHCKFDTNCQELFILNCKEAKDAANSDKGELTLIEKVYVLNKKGQKISRNEKIAHLPTKPLWKHEVIRKANCIEKAQLQCNSDKRCEEKMIRVCKRGAFFEGCRNKGVIKCGNQPHQKTCRVQVTHSCRRIYLGKHNHHRECVLRSKRNCPLGDKKCRNSFVRNCRRSLDSANPINGEADITIRTSYLVFNLERRDALRSLHPSRKNLKKWKRGILKKSNCRKLAAVQCKNKSGKCLKKFERGCKRRSIFHECKFSYANQVCRMGLSKNSSKCRVKFARRCRNTLLGNRSVKRECRARSHKHCPSTDKLCISTFVTKCRKALDAANPTSNGENDITILTLTK